MSTSSIMAWRERAGMSRRRLAAVSGLSPVTIRAAEASGMASPKTLSTLAEVFGITTAELLSGPPRTGITLEPDVADAPAPARRAEPLRISYEYDLVDVPRVSMEVAAGDGIIPEDQVEDCVPFRSDWLVRTFGAFKDHEQVRRRLCVVNVARDAKHGSSMEPVIRRGALLLVDRRELTPATLVPGKPYLVRREDDGIAVKFVSLADGMIVCESANRDREAYPTFTIRLEPGEPLASRVRGRVVWWAASDFEGYPSADGTWYRGRKRG